MSNYNPKSSGKSLIDPVSSAFRNPNLPERVSGQSQRQVRGSTNFFGDNQFGHVFVRTVVAMDPDSDLFMKVAQRAYQEHEKSLVPCSKCGRTFFPDRIEAHERSCAASPISVNQAKVKPLTKPQLMGKRSNSKVKTNISNCSNISAIKHTGQCTTDYDCINSCTSNRSRAISYAASIKTPCRRSSKATAASNALLSASPTAKNESGTTRNK